MRRLMVLVAVTFACFTLVGCAGMITAPVVPPVAMLYTGYQAPLDTDFDNTQMGSKKGEASVINVLGIVAVGDASAEAAAEDGRITNVMHADYSFLNVLGVFSKYTTIVYGE